jgi:hypothetical protein
MNWTINGTNISADIMRLSFPFNTTTQQRVNKFVMPTTNDIVFLYIGATSTKDTAAMISWSAPKAIVPVTPVTPVTPQGDDASFIKQSAQIILVLFVTYFMI